MSGPEPELAREAGLEERAAAEFLRCGSASWADRGERRLQEMLREPQFAAAYRKIEQLWGGVRQNANRPEFLGMREQALGRARRATRRRWSLVPTSTQYAWRWVAVGVGVALLFGGVWQWPPYGWRRGVYETGIGEQRMVELSDHSHIVLDAHTSLRVAMTSDGRSVTIGHGQAQFSVAHDAARPFKVTAGGHVIVAVGTIFTVEFADQTLRVAMMEGKVAVLSADGAQGMTSAQGTTLPQGTTSPTARSSGAKIRTIASDNIELSAGEELSFAKNGEATLVPKADIDAATAWREGKVVFHAEPLVEAVRRLNRYSRMQLTVEGRDLANMRVSGVFEAGDSRAFAEAVEAYLPVTADYSQRDLITLRLR